MKNILKIIGLSLFSFFSIVTILVLILPARLIVDVLNLDRSKNISINSIRGNILEGSTDFTLISNNQTIDLNWNMCQTFTSICININSSTIPHLEFKLSFLDAVFSGFSNLNIQNLAFNVNQKFLKTFLSDKVPIVSFVDTIDITANFNHINININTGNIVSWDGYGAINNFETIALSSFILNIDNINFFSEKDFSSPESLVSQEEFNSINPNQSVWFNINSTDDKVHIKSEAFISGSSLFIKALVKPEQEFYANMLSNLAQKNADGFYEFKHTTF